MRVLLATDSFPPRCGGSGWSTYELARGLRARGHHVEIVQPKPGTPAGLREREYDGLPIVEVGTAAPDVPYLRNYFKNERLYPIVTGTLIDRVSLDFFDIIHGQHVLTSLPAIEAAAHCKIPSVCTVRDYWPVCYWSDLIHTTEGLSLCPA